jgi:hypothetical protein
LPLLLFTITLFTARFTKPWQTTNSKSGSYRIVLKNPFRLLHLIQQFQNGELRSGNNFLGLRRGKNGEAEVVPERET